VRVSLLDAQPAVVLAFPAGGEVRDAPSGGQSPGFPIAVRPGGSARLTFEGGRYHAFPLGGATPAPVRPPAPPPPSTTTTTITTRTAPPLLGLVPAAPAPSPPAPPPAAPAAPPAPPAPAEPTSSRPLWAVPRNGSSVAVPAQGRRYRGLIEAQGSGGGLQLVNQLDVEVYLRGMGEVLEPAWPAASLRAQAIAARTYALKSSSSGRGLCDTQQCQVYLGETVEYAAMNKAVADTRGQVLVEGGSLIEAVYSANGGGVSASPEEGFGPSFGTYPYLRAAPYPTLDPAPWTSRLDLAALASRLGYGGRATGVRVSRAGPSGRALEVTVEGDAGPLVVDGLRFVQVLELRSSLFTISVGEPQSGGAPPAAQPPTDAVGRLREVGMADVSRPALGRAPWVGLAVLLLAGWATAASWGPSCRAIGSARHRSGRGGGP
jgi:SpoIID/LytB domain protein